MSEPTVSVSIVVPARNAEKVLAPCLEAIFRSGRPPLEVIVVDDRSDDGTAELGRTRGAKVLAAQQPFGAAAARNIGARNASGDVLLFIDSDVVIQPDTLLKVTSHFALNREIAAVFGSYDDEPAEQNFLSQYKNLQHHFVHQSANVEASTFWAGCGAVRRDVFLEVGGFDETRYREPSIEDIELGQRLRAKGYRIVLDKEMRVKHLKKWTLRTHVTTEIFNRAIPWSQLILEHGVKMEDLNFTLSHRISAALTIVMVLSAALATVNVFFAIPALFSLLGILLLNRRLYRFFLRQRGLPFLLKSMPFHLLHYVYSAAAFLGCAFAHPFRSRRFKSAMR